jgi:ferric iron reductase protein FhuF
MSQQAVALVSDLADLGPFFAIAIDPAGAGWSPIADSAADHGIVAAAIATARSSLAAGAQVDTTSIEPRVAASVWHLGLTARVVSPAVAAVATAGQCLDLGRLRWRPGGSAAMLGIAGDEVAATPVTSSAAAAACLEDGVVRTLVTPLTQSVAAVGSVSEQVLWGNVWSAVAGAASVIATSRPTVAARAAELVRAVVVASGAASRGAVLPSGQYRRDSCCLYYRLPRGGLCGDCVLRAPDERAQAPGTPAG